MPFFRASLVIVLISAPSSLAQSLGNCAPRVVVGSPTTDAGDGGPAVNAQLFGPVGLAKDAAGNLYIADSGNNKIRVVRPDGTIQTLAGTGVAGSTGDGGPATKARLNHPETVAVGPDGNIYIAESQAHRVRRIASDGKIHAVAGNGQRGFAGDGGPATQARLMNPSGVAFDADGNLYIADSGNYRVRRVTKGGIISTFAGVGYKLTTPNPPSDGVPAVSGYIELPGDLAFAPDGTLYIETYDRVESVTPDGQLHTVVGGPGVPAAEGLPADEAILYLRDVAVDAQGALLVVGGGSLDTVWKIMPDGTLHAVASTYAGFGLLVGGDGTITRSVYDSNQVMSYAGQPPKFDASPHQTVAGGIWVHGDYGDGGPGTLAAMERPGGIAADAAGNVYITDSEAGKIRKLDTKGIITTVAGNGGTARTPDGVPAPESTLNYPVEIAVSKSGEIYYAEQDSYRVRKIGTDHLVTTVAGNGTSPVRYFDSGYDFRDGKPATEAAIAADTLAVAGDGTLYIVDPMSAVIWRVTTDGILHKALQPFDPSVLTDTGHPFPLAADPGGSMYYLDPFSNSLMRLTANPPEVIRDAGDFLSWLTPFAIDGAGALYSINRINRTKLVKLPPDGSVSVLTDTKTPGPSPFLRAVTLDGAGNLFALDELGRVVEVPSATTCTPSVFPMVAVAGAVNAASYQPTDVAPGEIVSIFGVAVGPAKPAQSTVDAQGKLATKVGETQALFDGIPAPILYASSGQTTAIVPSGVSSQRSTMLQLSVNGFLSDLMSLGVADARPGIFTQNASGSGQGSILNEDYSVNSAKNPAKKGSVVMVYATGLGLVDPPVEDGAITGSKLSRHALPVKAFVNGLEADVPYAGTAPGLVAGASQINVRIPPETPPGDVSISITVGTGASSSSQSKVTVAVK